MVFPATSMPARPRIALLDIARGSALVAMAIYHFTWDLEFFGYVEQGTTAVGGWRLFARGIASSFLFLVGVSLYLAHAKTIRWAGFLKRLTMVAGAAAAISIVTYVAMPNGFIFFGILHQIALASVLGLLFLRLPAPLTLLLAAVVIALPYFWRAPLFDLPALWWVGLSATIPRSNDYVPLFPWFGAVLAGMGTARIGEQSGLFARLAHNMPAKWTKPLDVAGRHSLAFYLIHQPVLIGCVWLFSQISPAPVSSQPVQFVRACESTCRQDAGEEFCTVYCGCMLDSLQRENRLDSVFSDPQNDQVTTQVRGLADICTASTEQQVSREDANP
ncbi:DUF1624 domain-containing protein [Mesorhizobium sp. NBSH29]|uniref:DUF1624 domain-containing protein n=1 Tax=Mesorhizobium sp. NBSH29 TaxID=2654249 RepID=UPI0018969201|nr:DUF1624 domain-containing protein [Mesorhizobium sp. NBSH29]QPC87488.1 DUF1624 domain-containing protein [Mesorhizobium sp. NBSH29]